MPGLHEPTSYCNGWSNMASQYILTSTQVNALLHELNDPSFIPNLSKLFSSPVDSLISLMAYPFDVSSLFIPITMQDNPIIIGINTMQTTGKHIGPQTTPLLNLGQQLIARHFNNFLDFAPYTKIELYLPFIGFEPLDVDLVTGHTIKVRYAVDLYTGRCTAYVILNRDGYDTVIMTRDGQCGMPIQVAGGNGAEMARNLFRFAANTTSGAVSMVANAVGAGASDTGGSVAKTVGGAAGFLGSTTVGAMEAMQYVVHKGGHQESLLAGYAPLQAFLIFTRPKVAEPTSYAHTYGRPCAKTLTLNTLTGFTQVDAVHVEGAGFENATTPERDEIERLLKTGVLL